MTFCLIFASRLFLLILEMIEKYKGKLEEMEKDIKDILYQEQEEKEVIRKNIYTR